MGDIKEMSYPMRCLRCYRIHDAAAVTIVQRYVDCSTWRCPNCNSLIDDRPTAWGGSAVKADAQSTGDMYGVIWP